MEKYNLQGYEVEIWQDDCAESPREWDNLGTILYTSYKYNLGDNRVDREDIEEALLNKDNICLPVYAYIHSGVTLNTTGFSCGWDSGQCGIIYATKEAIRKEYGVNRITKRTLNMVYSVLKAEVDIFSKYLSGECYGFSVSAPLSGELVDSCGGFYGYNECKEAAKETVEGIISTMH